MLQQSAWQLVDAPLEPFVAIALAQRQQLNGRVAIMDSTHFASALASPATLRSIAVTFVDAAIFDEIGATFGATTGGMAPDIACRLAAGHWPLAACMVV